MSCERQCPDTVASCPRCLQETDYLYDKSVKSLIDSGRRAPGIPRRHPMRTLNKSGRRSCVPIGDVCDRIKRTETVIGGIRKLRTLLICGIFKGSGESNHHGVVGLSWFAGTVAGCLEALLRLLDYSFQLNYPPHFFFFLILKYSPKI